MILLGKSLFSSNQLKHLAVNEVAFLQLDFFFLPFEGLFHQSDFLHHSQLLKFTFELTVDL